MEMGSCIRINPNPVSPWATAGATLVCNAASSSSASSSSCRRVPRVPAAIARARGSITFSSSSHSISSAGTIVTCFREREMLRRRETVSVAALGTNSGRINTSRSHEDGEEEKGSDNSVALPDQQLFLQQQNPNANEDSDTDTVSIVNGNVEQQLQSSGSDTPSKPRRIALFVEPSPFAYVSGYKNRFQNFIKYLREMGDEVIVVTTHEGVPQEFYGAKLVGSWSFPCPWYQKVPLSLALSPRIISEVAKFKPDIIHASSPGIMVFGALVIAKLLCVPIVMSYHTHVPIYIPRYTFSWLVTPMWLIIKFLHRAADLTLVPSAAIMKDLQAARVTAADKIRLWNKGVDSESFHPRYRCEEMRFRLCDGEPQKPLIIYVGRLGVEKSLDFLKGVMDRLPGARIAFIGDGPYRGELEEMFRGMPAVFTGTLQGEELSRAYASGDVFVMPSESETLGFVVLEAMSSGVPVVAARAGGIPDIIPPDQDGTTSFLFIPGNLDDCVSKVEQLLASPDLREAMGRAARCEMEKFDWRAATRKIRNEQYNAAIWFWRKKRAQLLRPFQRLFRFFYRPPPSVNYS